MINMGHEFFNLDNVYLRGIRKEDYTERLFCWANDQEVTHYMITGLQPSIKEKMEQLYLDTIKKQSEVVFAIVRKTDHLTIGLVGLYRLDDQARHAEFRIIIGEKEMWGQGIGSQCAKVIIRYAFANLNLNKVWLGVNEENIQAVKSYEKTGFVTEGKLREEIYRNNKYYGAIRMSILKREWEQSNHAI